jgi:hypothetical protein
MDTKHIALRSLAAGEALDLSTIGAAAVVLVEGELQVQPPARWLAERVFVQRPLRITAPARLTCDEAAAALTLDGAKLFLEEEPGLWETLGRWLSALPWPSAARPSAPA